MYCIDGNIGSGKSTVLGELASRGYDVIQEDVTSWQPYLDVYYADKQRWAFTLQSHILHSLVSSQKPTRLCFTERDPFACAIFTRNCYDLGLMNDLEYNLFCRYYSSFAITEPSLRFFILTDPEECLRRIKTRNRTSEQCITIDYLNSVAKSYSVAYATLQNQVIYLDGSKFPCELADDIEKYI